jgi:hypothetical protein
MIAQTSLDELAFDSFPRCPVCHIAIRSPLDPAGNGFSKLPESERAVFSHLDFYFLILTLSRRMSFPGATR